MKKWWWLIVILAVVVGGGVLVWRQLRGGASAIASQAEIETAAVERGTLLITVEGAGRLASRQEVIVPFEAGGRVVEVLVRTGDLVEAGDLLAQLDTVDAARSVSDARLGVKKAEVSLALAQLSLDELLAWEPDEEAVELAEANLAAAQADYQKAATTRSLSGDQLTSSEVKLAQAQRALESAIDAYNDAYDPGRDWELGDRFRSARLESERDAASDGLVSAQDSLAIAQAAYNLEMGGLGDSGIASAWSKVVSARVNLQTESEPPSDDETDSARLQVEQAQVSLDQAKLSLASAEKGLAATQLAAPVAGTVTGMDLGLGQMVSNGQTGAVLADLTNLQVEIGLDESDIAQVSLGQPAQVTLDAFDDVVLDGVISHVAPTAEIQSGVVLYNVMVSLDATQIPARVGMTADVEVITRSAANTLIIPLKAVRSLNGGSFVLRRLRDGEEAPSFGARPSTGAQPIRPPAGVNLEDIQAMRAQMQNFQAVEGFVMARVELGVMTDAYAEVYSGLDEGDEVLVSSSAVTASAPSGPGGMFGVMRGRP